MKLNIALNLALISSYCLTSTTAADSGRKLAKGGKKNSLEGQYFSEYNFYPGEGAELQPGALYQSFTPVDGAPDIYDWVECFSLDGGSTFDSSKTGTAVLGFGTQYRINALEEEADIFDGFTIIGSIEGKNRLKFGLYSFFNTGTFLAIGKRTKVALGDDGCPIE